MGLRRKDRPTADVRRAHRGTGICPIAAALMAGVLDGDERRDQYPDFSKYSIARRTISQRASHSVKL